MENIEGTSLCQNVKNVVLASEELINNIKDLDLKSSQYGAIYFTHNNTRTITKSTKTYAESVIESCKDSKLQTESVCEKLAGIGYIVSTNFTSLH